MNRNTLGIKKPTHDEVFDSISITEFMRKFKDPGRVNALFYGELTKSCSGYKANFTAKFNAFEQSATFVGGQDRDPPTIRTSTAAVKQLVDSYNLLSISFERSRLIFDWLQQSVSQAADDDAKKERQEILSLMYDKDKGWSTLFDAATQRLYEVLDEIDEANQRAAAANAANAAQPGGAGAAPGAAAQTVQSQGKLYSDLKPPKMNFEMDPVAFEKWKQQLTAYCYEGNILNKANDVQLAVFSSVLSTEAYTAIRLEIPAGAPILSEDREAETMLKTLEQKYFDFHPLIVRRYNFFKHSQKENVTPAQFLTSLRELAGQAELEDISFDDIMVFRFMTGLNNMDLLKKINEVKKQDLNFDKIVEVVTLWTTLRVENAAMRHPGTHASKKTIHQQKQKTVDRGRSKSRGDVRNRLNSRSPGRSGDLREKLRKEGKCMLCARPKHQDGQVCPARQWTCRGCNKVGHAQAACYSRAKEAPKTGSDKGEASTKKAFRTAQVRHVLIQEHPVGEKTQQVAKNSSFNQKLRFIEAQCAKFAENSPKLKCLGTQSAKIAKNSPKLKAQSVVLKSLESNLVAESTNNSSNSPNSVCPKSKFLEKGASRKSN